MILYRIRLTLWFTTYSLPFLALVPVFWPTVFCNVAHFATFETLDIPTVALICHGTEFHGLWSIVFWWGPWIQILGSSIKILIRISSCSYPVSIDSCFVEGLAILTKTNYLACPFNPRWNLSTASASDTSVHCTSNLLNVAMYFATLAS